MKNEFREETLMTKNQYDNMFKHIDVGDCNIVVQKFSISIKLHIWEE